MNVVSDFLQLFNRITNFSRDMINMGLEREQIMILREYFINKFRALSNLMNMVSTQFGILSNVAVILFEQCLRVRLLTPPMKYIRLYVCFFYMILSIFQHIFNIATR